ncbi:MAG: hypothetical protein LBR63_14875 [Citrobacter amalonaticus]|nr:hypothetical protein [Citrobacter amalonaticus]
MRLPNILMIVLMYLWSISVHAFESSAVIDTPCNISMNSEFQNADINVMRSINFSISFIDCVLGDDRVNGGLRYQSFSFECLNSMGLDSLCQKITIKKRSGDSIKFGEPFLSGRVSESTERFDYILNVRGGIDDFIPLRLNVVYF